MNKIILNHMPEGNQGAKRRSNLKKKFFLIFSLFVTSIMAVSLIIFTNSFYYKYHNNIDKEMGNKYNTNEKYNDINVLSNIEILNFANVKRILGDTQINTWTASDQTNPFISPLSDGNFVIVWQSYLQDGTGLDIHGQIFYSNGAKKGNEFLVSNYNTTNQTIPSVASSSSGKFMVV